MRYSIGVDEAGRGPLAGPVAVGVVKVRADFDWSCIPGVGDSKQVSPKNRLAIFGRAQALQAAGKLEYEVRLESAKAIDTIGIVPVIARAIEEALIALSLTPADCQIKLDGSLSAPSAYVQETIIKGDATEPVIGLASILAKVTRDQYMEQLAAESIYEVYDFATHKGYGTKAHRSLIVKHGLSPQHRTSYCQNVKLWGKM